MFYPFLKKCSSKVVVVNSIASKKYSDYSGDDTLEKARYLKLRNKYGWWVGFVYIYGLLDAIVEAHLHPFNKVMSEDLEKTKVEVSKEQ